MHPENRSQPTVLVVEGYDDARELMSLWLTSSGYRVIEAGDGAEAVDLARRECPDVVCGGPVNAPRVSAGRLHLLPL